MLNVFTFMIIIILIVIAANVLQSNNIKKNKLFDEIYLMNLKRRPDRMYDFMKYYKQCDLNKYNLMKFEAVDGNKLDLDTVPISELAKLEMKQLETTGFRYKHYQLTKGAIGCYLSHVKIWENIVKNNYEKALVFEDDARPPPNFLKLVEENMKHIPEDWDIVFLGKICNECEEYEKYFKVERFMLTHSYLIKKSCIEKIIETNTMFPISQQIDAYLSELSGHINIYAVKNDIVRQGGSRTDIQAPIIKSSKNFERVNIF